MATKKNNFGKIALIGSGLFLASKIFAKDNQQQNIIPLGIKLIDQNGNELPFIANDKVINLDQIKQAFLDVAHVYGTTRAQTCERIYRLETANFTSMQFKRTYTAGMLAFGNQTNDIFKFPYGWSTFQPLWQNKSVLYKSLIFLPPNGYWATKIGGQNYVYLSFPTFGSALMCLAGYLQKYPAGRWNTTDAAGQAAYEAKLLKIKPQFT